MSNQTKYTNILDILQDDLSNGKIDELEYEFLDYYWKSLRGMLREADKNNVWVPHIGTFKISKTKLTRRCQALVKILRRDSWRKATDKDMAVDDFKKAWKLLQPLKKHRVEYLQYMTELEKSGKLKKQ